MSAQIMKLNDYRRYRDQQFQQLMIRNKELLTPHEDQLQNRFMGTWLFCELVAIGMIVMWVKW